MQLEFTAGGREFDLPDIDVMYAVGNAPMFKASAQLFHAIPSQHVNDSCGFRSPFPRAFPGTPILRRFLGTRPKQTGGSFKSSWAPAIKSVRRITYGIYEIHLYLSLLF